MIEQKDKIYERLSGGLFVLGIGWFIILVTHGSILFSMRIEQFISIVIIAFSILIYFLGKQNDNIPKIEIETEIEYRHKKEN